MDIKDRLKLFVFASMFYLLRYWKALERIGLDLFVCTFVSLSPLYLISNPGPCCAMLACDVWHGQLAQAA